MKKSPANKVNNKIIAGVLVLLVVILSSPYIWNHWMSGYYQKMQVEHVLSSELGNLAPPLKAMGFDVTKVKASCEPGNAANRFCDARLSSYVVIKSSPGDLNKYAGQLSDLLDKNGWYQRPDYLTKAWFKKISQQVDYQPDQLNTKRVGDVSCTLDFFTSFSRPKPAAVTLNADCSKGTPAMVPTD